MAMLSPPDRVWEFIRPLDTWKDRMTRLDAKGKEDSSGIPPMILNKQTASRISMSFVSTANKKQSKKRVIRLKLGSRLKTAINLVIVRGIDVAVNNNGRRKLVMNKEEAKDEGDKWILPGMRCILPSCGSSNSTIASRLELHFSPLTRSLPHVIPRSYPACAHCVAIYLGQRDEIGEKVGSSSPPCPFSDTSKTQGDFPDIQTAVFHYRTYSGAGSRRATINQDLRAGDTPTYGIFPGPSVDVLRLTKAFKQHDTPSHSRGSVSPDGDALDKDDPSSRKLIGRDGSVRFFLFVFCVQIRLNFDTHRTNPREH